VEKFKLTNSVQKIGYIHPRLFCDAVGSHSGDAVCVRAERTRSSGPELPQEWIARRQQETNGEGWQILEEAMFSWSAAGFSTLDFAAWE